MGLQDNKILQKFINTGEKRAGSSGMGIFVGVFAALGGILFGYDTGTISGVMAMPWVLQTFPANKEAFTASESSLIVSILSAGTFFGAILAPLLNDTLGRRWCLIISSLVVFNLGAALQTAAESIPLLLAGRVIAGFGVGLISSTIPLYQSEALPKWIRGAVVSCYQWAITIGIFLAAVVNQGTQNINSSASYRIPLGIQILWGLILGIGMIFLPETPRFYISKEKHADAARSLSRLRKLPEDHPELLEELDDIKAAHEFETIHGKSSWVQVFSTKKHQLKKLLTGVGLQAFQQLTGVNFIFYFGTSFFSSVGLDGFTTALATNIVNVGATIPGILSVEIFGRRKVLLTGAVGMCVSQLIVAIVGVSTDSAAANQVLVAFCCIFIAFFAATWGPTAWVVCGEIFPLRTRAKSIALCTASNWLLNWAIAFTTPYMVDADKGNLGTNVFFIWGGCNFGCFFFAYFMIYETKGLSLEQVDELYEKVPSARKSMYFNPSEHAFRQNAEESVVVPEEFSLKAEAVSIEEASV
ncbi:general substrate transporter [Metschnikowia bicuspidata var. bicuspidata NRRL YB-4993]|uniref:General substrate transporter n=1 Tax=Metschnikowia bicuspidata var. bicuspidata NRRL YB-4993 TaxID=869754 RepID=A0A1A0H5D9_9ASCO|nr:general substrate transporter [Metschnikowia bicuspidata var. bicuspidata NRRL YB-4993]OBA19165.1 general substrate transporter [Metschnikowia bicuspidata var. bicuspidata NRRL YB-4993]